MPGIMRPYAAQMAVIIIESITMEEVVVQQDSTPEPVRPPTLSEAAPQAPAATEVQAKVDSRQERKSDVDAGIKQRRVITIDRRPPNPGRVVHGNIHYLWI